MYLNTAGAKVAGGGGSLPKPPQIGGAGSNGSAAGTSSGGGGGGAPQLGGLFAGGMPKLKSRSGGLDTGGKSWAFAFSIYITTCFRLGSARLPAPVAKLKATSG